MNGPFRAVFNIAICSGGDRSGSGSVLMSSLINWAFSLIDVTCVLSENVSAVYLLFNKIKCLLPTFWL